MSSKTLIGMLVVTVAAPFGILAPACVADYTHESAVSLEWLTDSSHAIVVVDPVKDGKFDRDKGVPMRVVRLLKPERRVEVGQVRHVQIWIGATNKRNILFLREDADGKLVTHATCGQDLLKTYHGAGKTTLLGFDREGRLVQSIDHAISIVARRVQRGPNLPDPNDYEQAPGYGAGPFAGGFFRMAASGFDSFDYIVLVPADPDFRPLVEFESDLPLAGYINSRTLEKNYPGRRGSLSKRPLDDPSAAATMAAVFREISSASVPQGKLFHARRGRQVLPGESGANARRVYIPSADGKRLLARAAHWFLDSSLLDAETGETLFSGTIFGFSPTGRFFITRHTKTAYGIRRSDNLDLVCQPEAAPLPAAHSRPHVLFTPDDARVFIWIRNVPINRYFVFDLETGQQIAQGRVKSPYFFEILRVYAGASYFLMRDIDDSGHCLVNWRIGESTHTFEEGCQFLEVSTNDKTVAYVRSEPSDEDERTPDVNTLCIEELPSRRLLKSVELPCKPIELRFIAGGEILMTVLRIRTLDHRRNVALLYGVNSDEVDGETVSWSPAY